MKKLLVCVSMAMTISGCATPETILGDRQGHYVSCGGSSVGSVTGGYIGYSIQKNNDENCVSNYIEQGYKPVSK